MRILKSQITMQSHQLKNIFYLVLYISNINVITLCRIIKGQIGIPATCNKLFLTQFNPFCSMNKLPLNITTCSQTLSHGKICQYTPIISFLAIHLSHYITKKNSAWKGLWHYAQCVNIPNWQHKKGSMSNFYDTASWNTHLHFTYVKVFLNSFQVKVAREATEWLRLWTFLS